MNRKQLITLIKLIFSIAVIALIYSKVVAREGADVMMAHLSDLSWGWILAAACMQLVAISLAIWRWDLLLRGQGLIAPLRHLIGSFFIGRFFGAFTPSGLGLQGFRLYDIAVHTGKPARATASIGVEMVLGNLSFAAVIIAGSVFGARFLGTDGVLLVNAFFLTLIAAAILLLTRPTLFRLIAAQLPRAFQQRLQTTVDAVCAYQGRYGLIVKSALLGMGVHAFNNLIYVCAARALGAPLGVGEVFFASGLQILSTLVPASINGVGLREVTAVALYAQVGVPESIAILIPTVGFAVEMAVSSIGGLVFLVRRAGYRVHIQVENPDHEQQVIATIEEASPSAWPKVGRGMVIGLASGLLAGALVGIGEALTTLLSGSGRPDYSVLWYGGLVYALIGAPIGVGAGLALALSGRLLKREAVPEPAAFGRLTALLLVVLALPITAFRIRRDVFREELVWKSSQGLSVLVGCMLGALLLYLTLSFILSRLTRTRTGHFLLHITGVPAVLALVLAALYATGLGLQAEQADLTHLKRPVHARRAGNILFIVVDTLRADHLPQWGRSQVKAPNLDAFAKDATRFENAYSNASWTRPSFASLLTGRLPASHRTMAKSDSLPDELVTLPEALRDGGYTTFGTVTNYNVAPFFNFHQGFDRYEYLEPSFVLGANDTAAKLLFVQALRQQIEKIKTRSGQVDVGSAYRDAAEVNGTILSFLDEQPRSPFFIFAGYMDPHDPYYPHPYDGSGYSRAAHQQPDPSEAPRLQALYEGEITYWDSQFGQLIAELKQRGLYDEMTIVVTSDHGEEFMEHGGFWHGTTLYDEQVHVPLFVKFPGTGKGGEMQHWVQSIDIMPTLLEHAGLDIPKGVQGQNLALDAGRIYAEESHEGNVLQSVRTRREGAELKLIRANANNPRGLAEKELYEVDRDPQEAHNMADELQSARQFAEKQLQQAAEDAQKGRAARKTVDVAADDNAIDRLRALGYAGDE